MPTIKKKRNTCVPSFLKNHGHRRKLNSSSPTSILDINEEVLSTKENSRKYHLGIKQTHRRWHAFTSIIPEPSPPLSLFSLKINRNYVADEGKIVRIKGGCGARKKITEKGLVVAANAW